MTPLKKFFAEEIPNNFEVHRQQAILNHALDLLEDPNVNSH